ncbi:MAG: hypothetical protein M5U28_07065 [Sandaracinaceae bacterium]|nr:hypothetical protein [Sandaracinaceae bacterium]
MEEEGIGYSFEHTGPAELMRMHDSNRQLLSGYRGSWRLRAVRAAQPRERDARAGRPVRSSPPHDGDWRGGS